MRHVQEATSIYGRHSSCSWLDLARTIAHLGGVADIMPEHIAEAIQYRTLDRQLHLE